MTKLPDSQQGALPKAYWRLLTGYIASAFGDGMYLIAVNWWVVTSTSSAAAMGIVSASGAVTFVVLAPLAGRLIDRFGAVRLLIAADVWRAVILGLFVLLGLGGLDGEGIAFFVPLMVLMAVGTSVGQPGVFALIPAIVPPDDVRRANSIIVTGRSFATILGPAVGGALVGFAGVTPSIITNIGTFAVSAAVLWSLRYEVPLSVRTGTRADGSRRSARRLIFASRATTSAFAVALLGNLTLSMYTVTLPLKFAAPVDSNDSASVTYGLVQAAFQAGMVVVGIMLARQWANRIPTSSWSVGLGLICMGAAMVGVGYLHAVPALLILAALIGGSLMFVSVMSDPQLQLKVPEAQRGGVQGLVQGLGSGLRPLGILLATSVFGIAGAGPALLTGAIIAAAVAVVILVVDGYRDAINPVPHKEEEPDA
ncbi:MFS transporter [Brevibacterium casei]|uniref:MFS transporter n=1 Tax=Brevibacterium casei TaxID=33889 RepID=UPI0036FFA02B